MKAIVKYLMMMIAMLAMCVNFSSCRDTKEDPEPPITDEFTMKNTVWSFTEKYEEKVDGETVKYQVYRELDFGSKDMTYTIEVEATYGNKKESYSDYYNYTYTHSKNLVVMKPVDANLYNLEGTITSNIKMRVVNSDGDEIGIFYLED